MAIDHLNQAPPLNKTSDSTETTAKNSPNAPNPSPDSHANLDEPIGAPQSQGAAPAEAVGTADPDTHRGARGTAAMDPGTRREVARKGGLAVSRNRDHMAEIGRKGGQSVSRNRDHMARIGRKGGTASRGNES